MSESHGTPQPPQENTPSEQGGWMLYNAHDLHQLDCVMLPHFYGQRHDSPIRPYAMGKPVLRMRFEESELSHTIQQVTGSLQLPAHVDHWLPITAVAGTVAPTGIPISDVSTASTFGPRPDIRLEEVWREHGDTQMILSPTRRTHGLRTLCLKTRKIRHCDKQTRWYSSSGEDTLPQPVALDPASDHQIGDIYAHHINERIEHDVPCMQIWVWKLRQEAEEPSWVEVRDLINEHHPSVDMSHLLLRFTGSWKPSWVVITTAKRRGVPRLRYHVN